MGVSSDLAARLDRVEQLLETLVLREAPRNLQGDAAQPAAPAPAAAAKLPEGPPGPNGPVWKCPLGNPDDVPKLEEALQDPDKRASALRYLSRVGGRDSTECVRNIFSKVLAKGASLHFNNHGKRGKRAFSVFTTLQAVMMEGILAKFPELTETTIRKISAKWFTGSGDRDGGRQQRQKQNGGGVNTPGSEPVELE